MGKGGYSGGSTVIRVGSGWHSRNIRSSRRGRSSDLDKIIDSAIGPSFEVPEESDLESRLAKIEAEIAWLKDAIGGKSDDPAGERIAELKASRENLLADHKSPRG